MAMDKYRLATYKLLCKAGCIIILHIYMYIHIYTYIYCDRIVHEHMLSGLIRARKFCNFDMSGAIRGRKIIRRAVRKIRNVR